MSLNPGQHRCSEGGNERPRSCGYLQSRDQRFFNLASGIEDFHLRLMG